MTALTPNVAGHQDLNQFASRFVDVESLAWQPSKFDGVEFKTLLIDPDTGILTALVRMAPGAILPDHEHVEIEQSYVLSGRDFTIFIYQTSRPEILSGAPLEAAIQSMRRTVRWYLRSS